MRNRFTAFTLAVAASATPSVVMAQLGRQQSLVEPNIAADSTMLNLPYMTAAIVEAIKEARPILSITTLDSLLAS